MHSIHGASSAGPSTPTSDETSTAGTVRGLRDQENTTQPEYRAGSGESATTRQNPTFAGSSNVDCAKQFATLQARAALAGVALSRIEDDRGRTMFVCAKWALVKQLASVTEVEDFLARIGGRHAR